MFLYVIPIIFVLATFVLTVVHLYSLYKQFINEKQKSDDIDNYLHISQLLIILYRLRSPARWTMGRTKTREEYYLIEKNLFYP